MLDFDIRRSRRRITTRKQHTCEIAENETRWAGRTLARACVNRRWRTDWWSMRHKPEGAVLASAVKRGVRPRSSWLQESAWGDISPVGRASRLPDAKNYRMPVESFRRAGGCFTIVVARLQEVWPARKCSTYSTWTPAPPSPSTSSSRCRGKRFLVKHNKLLPFVYLPVAIYFCNRLECLASCAFRESDRFLPCLFTQSHACVHRALGYVAGCVC